MQIFLGVEDHKVVKTLSNSFNVALSGMYSIPIDLPRTAYNKAQKGGKIVKFEILKILKKRKTELLDNRNIAAEGLDMLSRLLLQSDENGSFSKEMMIANNIMGLMVASYDTTSATATFVLNYLAELPHIYNQAYKGYTRKWF